VKSEDKVKEKLAYTRIKEYVLEKYGESTHCRYSQLKRMYGEEKCFMLVCGD